MDLGDGIRKLGFRKWYERELLQSHAHLVLTFLCVIGLLAAFEAMSVATSRADRLVDLLAVAACAGVGIWALRRYLRLLMRAEFVANQAACPACGTYGRLKCLDRAAGDSGTGRALGTEGLQVCCNKCQHRWPLQDA